MKKCIHVCEMCLAIYKYWNSGKTFSEYSDLKEIGNDNTAKAPLELSPHDNFSELSSHS